MPSSTPQSAEELWTSAAYQQLSTLAALIDRSAARFSDDVYIDPVEPGIRPISFSDVETFSRGFELFLERWKVAPGQACAVVCNNSSTLVLLFLATIAADRIFVPINPNASAEEMSFIVDDCAARVVLYDESLAKKIEFLSEDTELVPFANDGAFIEEILGSAVGRAARESAPTPASIAEIVYTTGTTGKPKGVLLSHRNLLADQFGIGEVFGFAPRTRFLTTTPLFHNSGQIMTTLIPLYAGGITTAVRPDMGFINLWHYVDRFQPEWTLVMPSHIALMLDRREAPQAATLRGILCGGAKLEPATQLAFEERFGVRIYPNYGLTESASIATCARPDDTERANGSVGRPLHINRVRIFKGQREAVPMEVGEIRISGDNVFGGYLNRPEAFAEKVKDGWLHTGDLGYADGAGYVFIVDRIDNMILVGGENVYPSEVERFVPALSGVSEAFALSLPDRIMGRELVLVYKLQQGARADVKGWRAQLLTLLTPFKVPRRFLAVEEIGLSDFPRSASGKLLRHRLQRALESHAAPDNVAQSASAPTSPQFGRLAEVMAEVLEVDEDEIDAGTHMDHVPSWDSMAHLRLMLRIEEVFGVTLSAGNMARMTDVSTILEIIGTDASVGSASGSPAR